MRAKFTQSFKVQAVEKVLCRAEGVRIEDIADTLGVGFSTLQKWIRLTKNQGLETTPTDELMTMTKEKRPQDWNLEERLSMVIACGSLDEKAISELCREKGIFPHHVAQWKIDFSEGNTSKVNEKKQGDSKALKHEIKSLKKQLNRKDKALAETAALLVLQKKVHEIWGSEDEDTSL
jgi:transposase-like protein